MASQSFVVFFLLLAFNFVFGTSCGGLLEGERGHFGLGDVRNPGERATLNATCLWIVQLHYKTNIRFTLDALGEDSSLNLYPEDQLTSSITSNYTKLNSTHVGSSIEFTGKTLIVVLPNASASVVFSWDFVDNDDENNRSVVMKNSNYVSSQNGLLEWRQLDSAERATWGINANENVEISWQVDLATSCNATTSCACIYFGIFQLNSVGILREVVRTCSPSSEGQLKGISGRVVVVINVNTQVHHNRMAVSWRLDDVTVTEPPVTELPVTNPPVPIATGLFAATDVGLVALNLPNLEATALTNEYTNAVAVNHNLSKVYWSEVGGNSRIMRSNFDGTTKEMIFPQTGDWINMLAIDEPTGNIYFSLDSSHEITVCNALGRNCAAIISNSSFVNIPFGIALDTEKGFMYWQRIGSLVRANLDGSNAAIISTEFNNLRGITLDQLSHGVLYWVDNNENTIGTIDVNGGNKRILVELEGNPGPHGIQIDAKNIYIGNWHGKNIQSVNMGSGKDLTTIFNSTSPVRHLALFYAPVKQSSTV